MRHILPRMATKGRGGGTWSRPNRFFLERLSNRLSNTRIRMLRAVPIYPRVHAIAQSSGRCIIYDTARRTLGADSAGDRSDSANRAITGNTLLMRYRYPLRLSRCTCFGGGYTRHLFNLIATTRSSITLESGWKLVIKLMWIYLLLKRGNSKINSI